jgi:uncharacterized membrane protein HdeD (DUF308 family)
MDRAEPTMETLRPAELRNLRRNWGWFVALGIGLIILGFVAAGSAVTTTVVSMVIFGWLLIIASAMEIITAFYQKTWGGMFIDLLMGVLYGVVGVLMLVSPAASALSLTLLIAMFLIVGGIFRLVASVTTRYPHWGWLALHGLLALTLGMLIWLQWPVSGLWVIGLFIGLELFFNGVTLLALGLTVRKVPLEGQPE